MPRIKIAIVTLFTVVFTGIAFATIEKVALTPRPKIYLGGPDVFFPNANTIAEEKKKIAEKYGFEGVFPADTKVLPQDTPFDTALLIFKKNIELMKECDLMAANMSPFRGPSMDAGTAFEMGFMMGQGKPVIAYTDDPRHYADRVAEFVKLSGAKVHTKNGVLRDNLNFSIENFGMADNLMLHGVVHLSHASIERSLDAALAANGKTFLEQFKKQSHHSGENLTKTVNP